MPSVNNRHPRGFSAGNTREKHKGGSKRRYRRDLSRDQLRQMISKLYNSDGRCYNGYLYLISVILNQWNHPEHRYNYENSSVNENVLGGGGGGHQRFGITSIV